MRINFTKMHSLGNNFIVIDAITQIVNLTNSCIKKLADHKIGIGCDQIILLEPPIDPLSDFYYKIYNADGSIAEQCLNGVRCAARFAIDCSLSKNYNLIAECSGGKVILIVKGYNLVSASITKFEAKITTNFVDILGYNLKYHYLSVGNPHLICLINEDHNVKIGLPDHLMNSFYDTVRSELNNQLNFNEGINIGFAKIINSNNIELRVFERGCGETLACGSNALAAFIVANDLKFTDSEVRINFKLGSLEIKMTEHDFIINGPVHTVCNGKFKI